MAAQRVLEGTWEEIKQHEAELKGRRLRVIIDAFDDRAGVDPEPIFKLRDISPWMDVPRPDVEPSRVDPLVEAPKVTMDTAVDRPALDSMSALPLEPPPGESLYDSRA